MAPPSLPYFVTYKPREQQPLRKLAYCVPFAERRVSPLFKQSDGERRETGLRSGFRLLSTLPIKARALGGIEQ